jgi:hypothetical protein
MHAVLVRVNIRDNELGEKLLKEQIVPRVSSAPGFVTGHWTRSDDASNGVSLIVFESEENARAMADGLQAGGIPDDAVDVESVEVREVVANA